MMRAIEIVGGGLAGLALGTALQRAGISVTVNETGTYPRQRTCGEFIHGLDLHVIDRLGLAPVLAAAPRRTRVSWTQLGGQPHRWKLPRAALVASRHTLDAWLADTFRAAGGTLITGATMRATAAAPGRVFASGRRTDRASPWFGLKVHVRHLHLDGDLEFHVGHRAYVGACRLEDDQVNLCGLFHRNSSFRASGPASLSAHARAAGLHTLADRVDAAEVVPQTMTAVAGLRFGLQTLVGGGPCIGDAFAFVPPFTGRGMAAAFTAAAAAIEPLTAWARGALPWDQTVRVIHQRQLRLHRGTLRRALGLHRFLIEPRAARAASLLLRARAVPMRSLTRLLAPSRPCFSTL